MCNISEPRARLILLEGLAGQPSIEITLVFYNVIKYNKQFVYVTSQLKEHNYFTDRQQNDRQHRYAYNIYHHFNY